MRHEAIWRDSRADIMKLKHFLRIGGLMPIFIRGWGYRSVPTVNRNLPGKLIVEAYRDGETSRRDIGAWQARRGKAFRKT
jgi:hypothetical protein